MDVQSTFFQKVKKSRKIPVLDTFFYFKYLTLFFFFFFT